MTVPRKTKRKDEAKPKRPHEAELANYWREKTGLEWSDFDVFNDDPKRVAPRYCRGQAMVMREMEKRPLNETTSVIAGLIWNGWPLSREEYYVALAVGLIVGDVSYTDFFKYHWFENKEKRGYSSIGR